MTIRNFVFDCGTFAPAMAKPCAAAPSAEQTLLDLVDSYRVSGLPCSVVLADKLDSAEAALHAVAASDPQQLAPLDRALLQNAALELLSCAPKTGPKDKPSELAAAARAVLPKFVLSPEELATLPTSAEQLNPWLGDGASWLTGTDTRFFHTRSDGFARVHHQVQRDRTLADVVRLVLVDKAGAPYVSDIVQRVVIRRLDSDGIHVCFAERNAAAANCGTDLRGLTQERGQRVLDGSGTPPCNGCHTGNHQMATPYGARTGFALADSSATRVRAALKDALAR